MISSFSGNHVYLFFGQRTAKLFNSDFRFWEDVQIVHTRVFVSWDQDWLLLIPDFCWGEGGQRRITSRFPRETSSRIFLPPRWEQELPIFVPSAVEYEYSPPSVEYFNLRSPEAALHDVWNHNFIIGLFINLACFYSFPRTRLTKAFKHRQKQH